jgi:integrase
LARVHREIFELLRSNKVIFKNFNKTVHIQRLSELTPEVLEEYKLARKQSGVQASTINRELITLKSALKKASEWKYASADVWGVRKMPEVKKHPVFFTLEEINKLMASADPLWKLIVYLGFYAGLRRGEMLSLEWQDFDFERHIMRVTPKINWHPKDYEAREIPLHTTLEEYLKVWKKLSQNSSKVVPWNQPSPYLTLYFSKLLKRTGINKGSLHSLRHSFASHLAMRGIDLHRIGRMMGHSSVVTTQIYAHLLPSSLNEALSLMPVVSDLNSNANGKHSQDNGHNPN